MSAVYAIKGIIFLCLFAGFTGLLFFLRKSSIVKDKLQEAYENMDAASMVRAREHKRDLTRLQEQKGIFYQMEQRLTYSGLSRRFPFLTLELWILTMVMSGIAVYFLTMLISKNWILGLAALVGDVMVLYMMEGLLVNRNYRAVDDELMSFLNLLGNYSMTAGEVTGVFQQVGKYVKEPLKSVLVECYYEAQTSGDSSLALFAMADKIEHPKFKELVRNIEVCSRYSADFPLLVSNSRKVIQEYMRSRQERKSMANEAIVNMVILGILLVVVLISVDQMIQTSIWTILLHKPIGQGCFALVIGILVWFYWQVSTTDR